MNFIDQHYHGVCIALTLIVAGIASALFALAVVTL